ncbi:CusA/CzcA family heavy metal efflux RND transporter [Mucilaginibacter myungsuensis]|uniref:CusA/CzcA family heavy metal efflux RND transporter n=1 Tax=Mucilaginibacter myungsuensis TaxID=649104 RepID=A0A929L2P6_9SPHI|nr:CusA/CzcA family heavy metal efflux RND transporter [Mucilaginibacter myungsuensis]MBE9662985.1 CusA/CzcA family heavy metal efflux RND transporter [Mucilaginibacter myungsuensis]MDN3598614.1 CusA/CzcA family heavy metal efflux RND transporter [Mucilaginibacter myungsuensis]
MFDKIIAFSISNKLVVGAFIIILIAAGIFSLSRLPIDAQPDITNNQVQIITQAPTLGAQEVEQYITAPIELAIANVPKVIEKRSISRSGLSVITVVFEDNADIYWARQQISEGLKEAESQIPKDTGEPTLAPITTGLGEIYQYVIHTKPGYENKYSPTDLRTMQDWIVRRQLAGTPGIAEISGWGGYVKQYEIAIDNERLNSLNITVSDIYTVLEKNNQNTGGSYIEQRSNAYFIRGLGQVKSLDDIEHIVVKNREDAPVVIGDVAKVQYGSANRYGAVTRNGQGEVVAGVALMLKGENFNEVIKRVKERMAQVQKSLPEGVVIEPFIDRTELVGRAIGTVERNLIEGGLIVVFILVLLLGNLRAGLVVASVIPLAMLFAVTMMYIFGVSGNLMSLGAIDFGLIVDGAVIIVEAIVHRITEGNRFPGKPKLSQQEMDGEVYEAASKIRDSAAFGEIIILIVYLPLFALVGIEGKMFRPMAETVAFAILGAFILSLTYVPMASALFLSKNTHHKRNISDRLVDAMHRIYIPALNAVLRAKKLTVFLSVCLLALAVWAFAKMGGEFIPTLEEGDLTVEIAMMQGTSLSQVIETFGKAEKLLKSKFPEIKQAVTRIGSAEVPTDPMPFERGDMMLSMKPKDEWTSAADRAEMMEKIEETLKDIPGINVEVTQPMQMRFNELMTGIRQDVAIKIFGDDLDVLSAQADKAAKLISTVNGVSEPIVEKVSGLPQVAVTYDRHQIAQYGLNIEDVNTALSTAFAGRVAGVVFEGEKRFEIVLRLERKLRSDIVNIENLYIPLPSGNKVPLSQVASIQIEDAPSQISREDGKRRIYVGFNVRGRDIESTVKEIQQLLSQKLKLPAGYYTTYGGQFQNLQVAKVRLGVAVPVALLLILMLLYFTFRSVRETLLIFSAVPLSAVGGVAALYLRGMPFSISAGVGFIALFGVAVLNGIVLIGYFNQLAAEGITDIVERVKKGTQVRLRPVLMTAAVASLGFLPMAISSTAGAEVQRPLATVVIGGLISATLLTLLVLPVLYILFTKNHSPKMQTSGKLPVILLVIAGGLLFSNSTKAQENKPLTLNESIEMAIKNNPQLRRLALEVSQNRALQGTAFDPAKTDLTITQDPTSGGNIDNSLGITQTFAFPTVYTAQRKVLNAQTGLSEKTRQINQNDLIRQVKTAWYELLYAQNKLSQLSSQDSLYKRFSERAALRYKTGETSYLEQLSAVNAHKEIQVARKQAEADVLIGRQELQQLLAVDYLPVIVSTPLTKLKPDTSSSNTVASHPQLAYYQQRSALADAQLKAEKSRYLPDLTLGYRQQLLVGAFNPANINRNYFPGTRVGGFEIGVAVPLFFGAQKSKVKAAQFGQQIAQADQQNAALLLAKRYNQTLQELTKYKEAVTYYEDSGLKQASEQIRIAQFAYSKGEIGYVEFIQNMTQAVNTRLAYLAALRDYNKTIIELDYLTTGGNQK